MLLSEILDELGTPNDFLGHPGDDNFVVITSETAVQPILARLKARFSEEVQAHYNFIDRENKYLTTSTSDGVVRQHPMMTLSKGVVNASQFEFTDIREITEVAAEARRLDRLDNIQAK